MSDIIEKEAKPLFFPVSIMKLVLLSVCTLGFYELYWFYKNWKFVNERENLQIWPIWRAFFAFFFCYSLFARINVSSDTLGIESRASPGVLAAAWIIVTLSWKLPDPYMLISFLAVFALVPIQKVVNDINHVAAPGHDTNKRFGPRAIGLIVAGSILLFFAAVDVLTPGKGGVLIPTNTERTDWESLERQSNLRPDEVLLAYYDGSFWSDGLEVVILTSKRIMYREAERTYPINLSEIINIEHRDEGIGGDVFVIEDISGNVLRIVIPAWNDGEAFKNALMRASGKLIKSSVP